MNRLMKKFNISENIQIPNAKSTYRNHKINYRCIYTDEMKERIAEIFKDEIELFGYQY